MAGITRTSRADNGRDFEDEYKFMKVDVPSAADTQPQGINPQGDIVGFYIDRSGDTHGFLLSEGRFTTIDVPGAAGFTEPWGERQLADFWSDLQRAGTDRIHYCGQLTPRISRRSRMATLGR
jgi:hypothetical protein